MTVMRMTPIYLATDMEQAQRHYERLGLHARQTDEPGCVGYFDDTNTSRVIVIGDRHAAKTMPPAAIEVLREKGGLYVWVHSIDETDIDGEILGEMLTPYGTRERFIETEDSLTVLAEKLDHFIEIPRRTN